MQDLRRCALSGLRLLTVMLLCALSCACCHKFGACGSIPVDEVPCELLAQPREALLPINFSMLGQPQPPEHLIDTGDTLGVYVKGVLDLQESPRPVEFPTNTIDLNIKTPSVGFPLKVGPEGEVDLPLLGDVAVRGLSLDEATDTIRKEYVAREIVSKNADQTVVWLIKPRTTRVVVIREDSPVTSPVLNGETDYTILSKRGTSQLVELPAYENDVLHALSASGGLPGTDAENEVIIFRSIHGAPAIGANGEPLIDAPALLQSLHRARPREFELTAAFETEIVDEKESRKLKKRDESKPDVLKAAQIVQAQHLSPAPYEIVPQFDTEQIPLRSYPGELLPFGPSSVILQPGDVVYVPSRESEVFYTGGLLRGAKIPLPRDYDLDVLNAIAVAHGFLSGPATQTGVSNFRGPGNIVPPSRVIIVRKTPDGGQVKIRVDLAKAVNDPSERILIRSGDIVMLQYKPHELMINVSLNLIGINYNIPNN